jgi:hypothetical protein
MVKFNELNQPKIKKTGNSKLYKNFLKILMSAGLLTTSLAGCAPVDKPTDPIIVDPTDPVDEKTELQILAEEYEFLAWYLDDAKTKTVDGFTYDLVALKQQYGDLYRFVEPLSKEEVEYRFQYLAEYFADRAAKGSVETTPAGLSDMTDLVFTDFTNSRKESYEKLANGNISELADFTKYYYYLEKTQNYYRRVPKNLLINDEFYNKNLIDLIGKATYEDKNWFIRDYMLQVDLAINAHKHENEELEFIISINQKTK